MANIVEWKDEKLPPVGAIVELIGDLSKAMQTNIRNWSVGERLECVAHRESESGMIAVFWNIDYKTAGSLVKRHGEYELYRKIKTDREKAIEAAVDILIENPISNHNTVVGLSKLFDAGMLKLPD